MRKFICTSTIIVALAATFYGIRWLITVPVSTGWIMPLFSDDIGFSGEISVPFGLALASWIAIPWLMVILFFPASWICDFLRDRFAK